MNPLQTLGRRISTDRFDARLGRLASYVAGLLMLFLGIRKLLSLPLTEVELYFGMLLILTVTLLAIVIGLLLGLQADRT